MKKFAFASLFIAMSFVQVGCGEAETPAPTPVTTESMKETAGGASKMAEMTGDGAKTEDAAKTDDAPKTDAPKTDDAAKTDDAPKTNP